MIDLYEISVQVENGRAKIVKEMVQKAIDEGISPKQILNEGLLSGMDRVGEKFKNQEFLIKTQEFTLNLLV